MGYGDDVPRCKAPIESLIRAGRKTPDLHRHGGWRPLLFQSSKFLQYSLRPRSRCSSGVDLDDLSRRVQPEIPCVRRRVGASSVLSVSSLAQSGSGVFIVDLRKMPWVPLSIDAKHRDWILKRGFMPCLEWGKAKTGTEVGVTVQYMDPNDS